MTVAAAAAPPLDSVDLAPGPRPAGRRVPVWLAIVAASLPMFMATLDNLVMTSALPVVRADLGSSVSQLSWFMNAYTLTFATFMPLSLTLLAVAVPPAKRAIAIGVWGGVSGLGVALGPVVGGAVVEGVSWQAIFWLNVPVALVAGPLLLVAVRESRGNWQRLDLVGAAMLGGAVFLGIWGIVHGNDDDGWSAAGVLGPLVIAALLVPAYVGWARGRAHAVLPLRLFSSRGFSVANAIGLMFTLGVFGTVFLLSQYLQIVQGYSPLEAGLRTLPWTAAPMVVAPIAGLISARTGLRALLLTGLVLQSASLVWFAMLTESGAGYPSFVVPLAMAGVGMGLTFAPSATAVLEGLPEADFTMASSANSTIREFGVALGVAVLSAVFLANGGRLSPGGYDGAIGPALLTGAAAVAVALLAALFAPGRAHPSPDA